MSIYKKFIESSSTATSKSTSHINQSQQFHSPVSSRQKIINQLDSGGEQKQDIVMMRQKSCIGGRVPIVRMSPSSLGSPLSSTPLSESRNNYKRLIPSDDFASAHFRAAQNQYEPMNYHTRTPSNIVHRDLSHHKHNHQHQEQLKYHHHQQQQQHFSSSCCSLNQTPLQHKSNYTTNSSRHLNLHQRQQSVLSPMNLNQQQAQTIDSVFRTDDPVLLEWMKAMRFETELECLTALQARTLAIDDNLAGALSVRNSQVAIQEMRLESDYILDLVDILIDQLPLNLNSIDKFAIEFSNLWSLLVRQTEAQTRATQNTYTNCQKNLTIVNCTPRKSLASARTLRPLDDLANKIRQMCIEMANTINKHQDQYNTSQPIDNGHLEAILRRIKELFGKFVEISIRAECANIVRALHFDFSSRKEETLTAVSGSRLESVTSGASLRPVRVYKSNSSQLPLKWALIALWQLTKNDGYICRLLTEMWQTGCSSDADQNERTKVPSSSVAKRLDYSTKYEPVGSLNQAQPSSSRPEKPLEICQKFKENQQVLLMQQQQHVRSRSGALSSALKSKQPVKQVSTIELLIDIIISQPNKHERVDMMNFMQNTKLVDVEELDQSVSAAFYTSNQYKVAALRILNHLCMNEQAIKTILKCFSTPPPKQGQPTPQNKIIKSVFECYQIGQEHIYQNETIFNVNRTPSARRQRKRARQVADQFECEEYSDYGSRQTNSVPTSESVAQTEDNTDDEGDDAVVKEAIRLLVQLTTPFHRSNQGHDYYTLIGRFSIETLVRYLTNIVKSAISRDMVLLSLSALANISFITTEPMRTFDTTQAVLEMFEQSKGRSKDLEMRDQAVTILANMADKSSLDIVNNGALTFLLSCLEICPTRMSNYKPVAEKLQADVLDNPYARIASNSTDNYSLSRFNIDNTPRDRKPIQMSDEFIEDLDCACDNQQRPNMPTLCLSRLRPSELAAMERIHQKTAVAFARLSADSSATRLVLKYGGVKQMIDLCKLSNRRNHSDTVLIACLAALRKISKVIGRETFRHYNALDLIELELNQALEIYGCLYASEV